MKNRYLERMVDELSFANGKPTSGGILAYSIPLLVDRSENRFDWPSPFPCLSPLMATAQTLEMFYDFRGLFGFAQRPQLFQDVSNRRIAGWIR